MDCSELLEELHFFRTSLLAPDTPVVVDDNSADRTGVGVAAGTAVGSLIVGNVETVAEHCNPVHMSVPCMAAAVELFHSRELAGTGCTPVYSASSSAGGSGTFRV